MRVHHLEVVRRRLRRATIFLLLGNLLLGMAPAALAGPGGPFAAPFTTLLAGTVTLPAGAPFPFAPQTLAPSGSEPSAAAPAFAPQPLILSNNVSQNFTPYAPSAFSFGQFLMTTGFDGVNIANLSSITINQTGNLSIGFNGTWNPAPATQADRDWVLAFIVRNGAVQAQALESNTTFRTTISAGQIPFTVYFAMPTPVASLGATANARVVAFLPSGNSTVLNLTAAGSGMLLTLARVLNALPTESVWFNTSGSYPSGGVLSGSQTVGVVVPADGGLPFEVRGDRPTQWTNSSPFPGGRIILLKGSGSAVAQGTFRVTMWTRGSPESSLYINATVLQSRTYRNDSLNITGVAGNLTLAQTTSWSPNTTSVMPASSRGSSNCNNLVRLVNGTFRMFCNFNNGGNHGVESAWSRDGLAWSWESGIRHEVCNGNHPITQLTIMRLLDGTLRMYYGGSETAVTCTLFGSGMHTSRASSSNEGLTWNLDSEDQDLGGVAEADARAIVPTAEGHLRMYFDSPAGLRSSWSDDGVNWNSEGVIGGAVPRTLYTLTDGSYKMFYGTTTIGSRVSTNGLSWSPPVSEVNAWGAGNIEALPILDRGDGTPRMMIYSQTFGLFLATPNTLAVMIPSVNSTGRVSDGQVFGSMTVFAGGGGAFQSTLTLPVAAPLGRYFVGVNVGFGENRFRGVVLNRMPVWSGPAVLNATEDQPLLINFTAWASDGDAGDTLQFFENSPYVTMNGSVANFSYPNGVTSDTVLGIVGDGRDLVGFTILVNVTPFNDPPTIVLNASYLVDEDRLDFINFASAVGDEETPGGLTLSTNVSGATVAGLSIGFNYSDSGSYPITVSVWDGNSLVNATTILIVTPLNDAPVISLAALYSGTEDLRFVLNFSLAISDADTPRDSLFITTDFNGLWGPVINGFEVSINVTDPLTFPFTITVSDGNLSASDTSILAISARNDAPVWDQAPDVTGVTEGQRTRIDLFPLVHDDDNLDDELTFTVDSQYTGYVRINGDRLELEYGEGILFDSFNLTVSDGQLSHSIRINVTIGPTNSPPVLTNVPPSNYTGPGALTFQLTVFDPDSAAPFTFALTTAEPWITLSAGGLLRFDPGGLRHGRYPYSVVVSDNLGAASVRYDFNITLPDNNLPSMSPALPGHAVNGTEYTARFNVTDLDVADVVSATLQLNDTSQTVALTSSGARAWSFVWTPNYNLPPPWEVYFNGSVVLNDTYGEIRVPFSIRVTDPSNRPPEIFPEIPAISGNVSQTIPVDLTGFMTDPDTQFDPIGRLTWTFDGNVSSIANLSYDPQTHILSVTFTRAGSSALTFILTDPSGQTDSQAVAFTGLAGGTGTPGGPTDTPFPWWLILVIGGAAAGGVVAWRRLRTPGPRAPVLAETPPTSGSASPAAPRAVPAQQPVIVPMPGSKRTFLVEDLFLLYRDGRTIFTRAGLAADAVEDPESVGAMLIAVQDFVKDSFRKNSPVDRMGYGDNVILLEQGGHVMLAVTVYGEPNLEFREMLTETIRNVEATYAGVIENWSGNRAEFVGVETILAPIWKLTSDLTRGDVLLATTAREVQMLSGVEFFQGYVRVKVGIVNNTSTVITGITVDLDFNGDVLRLAKVEPATYKMAGAKVNLGVLHTGEKATLAYYFDPQICTMSMVDGTCRYKDAEGQQHIVQMKSRKAEVVCPLFFTKEQANTAMLRRLVETELKQFDVRAYSFKSDATAGELGAIFETMKAAVLSHEVITVRAYERHNPYTAEAWFYGKTQVKGYQMVIRALVDEEKGRAEFFVASSVMRTITGLLAELHHTFQDAAKDRLRAMQITALFDEDLRSQYADVSAVSKMIEGEADAGETDAP